MAKQRYINTKFWRDSYIEDLDPIEKLLFLYLLSNPAVCQRLGARGKEIVTKNFLMPRLARDELRLIKSLLNK